MQGLSGALEAAKQVPGRPHAIVLDTLMGKGVPLFEQREKNHFIRVDAASLSEAETWIRDQREFWDTHLDRLAALFARKGGLANER